MKDARAGKWLEGLKKYRLAALAALLGIVLMLLPGGNAEAEPTAGRPDAEAFDRGAVQEERENILRAIDGVNPMDESFVYARSAGITCVCTGPGSANVLGGTFTAIKTAGTRIDDMIVKKEAAMKCAFGENPKRCYASKCDSSRMTTAAILR